MLAYTYFVLLGLIASSASLPMRRGGRERPEGRGRGSQFGWNNQQHQPSHQPPSSASSSSPSPRLYLVPTDTDPATGLALPPLLEYYDPHEQRIVLVPGMPGVPLPIPPEAPATSFYHQYPQPVEFLNEHEGLANQFGSMSMGETTSSTHSGQVYPPPKIFYPHAMVVDNSAPLQQPRQGLSPQRSLPQPQPQHLGSSSNAWTPNEGRDPLENFCASWDEKGIDPSKLTPQSLADEVLRIQATINPKEAINVILSSFVEPKIDPDDLLTFQDRLKLLWLKYSSLRASRKYSKQVWTNQMSEESHIDRERDAEDAIRAASSAGHISHSLQDVAASEYFAYFIRQGDDFSTLGYLALVNISERFLKELHLPSDFRSKAEFVKFLVEYLHNVCQNFPQRLFRRLANLSRYMDTSAAKASEVEFIVKDDE